LIRHANMVRWGGMAPGQTAVAIVSGTAVMADASEANCCSPGANSKTLLTGCQAWWDEPGSFPVELLMEDFRVAFFPRCCSDRLWQEAHP
jgi:hypothetical protein